MTIPTGNVQWHSTSAAAHRSRTSSIETSSLETHVIHTHILETTVR
jgi:hypothetical protein